MDELIASGLVIALIVVLAVAGGWLAKRLTARPYVALAGIVVVAALASLLAGGFSGAPVAAAGAVLAWSALIGVTAFVVTRLRGVVSTVAGVVGGLLAVQAGVIAYVLTAFGAHEAPREYALLWLPAVLTGAVADLGEPLTPADTPLWVRLSEAMGGFPLITVAATALVLGCLVRRRQATQLAS